jgi:hypothetical protein
MPLTRRRIQISECLAGRGEFAAHAQALKEVDGRGERGAGGGKIATQGVEAGGETLESGNIGAILVLKRGGDRAGAGDRYYVRGQGTGDRGQGTGDRGQGTGYRLQGGRGRHKERTGTGVAMPVRMVPLPR